MNFTLKMGCFPSKDCNAKHIVSIASPPLISRSMDKFCIALGIISFTAQINVCCREIGTSISCVASRLSALPASCGDTLYAISLINALPHSPRSYDRRDQSRYGHVTQKHGQRSRMVKLSVDQYTWAPAVVLCEASPLPITRTEPYWPTDQLEAFPRRRCGERDLHLC